VSRRPARRGYRRAGYDNYGVELTDWDVLSPEELAEDYGYVSPSRRPPEPADPEVKALLVEFQRRSS
jgi:hypothetical protein